MRSFCRQQARQCLEFIAVLRSSHAHDDMITRSATNFDHVGIVIIAAASRYSTNALAQNKFILKIRCASFLSSSIGPLALKVRITNEKRHLLMSFALFELRGQRAED